MKISIKSIRLVVLSFLLFSFMQGNSQETKNTETLALVGAKIYPSPNEKPILDGVVLTANGKIIEVGKSNKIKIPSHARIIDCTGLVMMSGFWNCHVHFMEPQWQKADKITAEQLNQQMKSMLTQ